MGVKVGRAAWSSSSLTSEQGQALGGCGCLCTPSLALKEGERAPAYLGLGTGCGPGALCGLGAVAVPWR